MMPQMHRIAVGTMIALIGAGLVYAVIMCVEVGIADGWLLIRNDPGKFIFHLLLLPLSFGALIWSVPTSVVSRCLGRSAGRKIAVLVIGIGFTAFAVVLGVQEAIDGFEDRPPVPTDVREIVTREGGQQRQARAGVLTAWRTYHDMSWSPASPSADAKPPFSAAREAAYTSALTESLGGTRDFWSQASVAAWWSAFLSIQGILLIGAWALMLIVIGLEHGRLDEPQVAALVLAFCTGLASMGVWFYFKIYSEWYIHFYAVSPQSLVPLVMTVVAAVILAVAAVLLRHPQKPLTWFTALSAIGGALTGAAAYWKPELLQIVADAYRRANDPTVVGLWMLLAIAAFITAYLIGADPQPSSPPSPLQSPAER
jgi:hypothetical protein